MNDMQFADKEEDEFILQEIERDERARLRAADKKLFGPVEVVTKEEIEEILARYGPQ